MPCTMGYLDIALAALGVYLIKRLFQAKSRLPLPPGPKGVPILGNIFEMPSEKAWLAFEKLSEKHGNLSSMNIFGHCLILVNSAAIAEELLDKRSVSYSDRPPMVMAGELSGWNKALLMTKYGERFRQIRKYFHQAIGARTSIRAFVPIVEHETLRFAQKVLCDDTRLEAHVRKTAGAIILRISHGYEVQDGIDPLVELADKALEQLSETAAPGAYLVDIIPILKYIPEWFPGAGFQKTAKRYAKTLQDAADQAHNYAKTQIASGIAPNSFTSRLFEGCSLTETEEDNVKWAAASVYLGGSDTTVSANYAFFLAMTLYPDVQKKAQAELDVVIGKDRLPTYADRGSLPYVEALFKEILRWNIVAPLTIRRASKDDVCGGYFIPKDAHVIVNIWHILHDERTYVNPMEFNPERFLASEGREPETDPRNTCFGYGRRICPGLHLAEVSVFMTCALSLAVLDVRKTVENGVEITPEIEYLGGSICHPAPFKCSIKARSIQAEALLSQSNDS
ncbi:hypothetical protein SERLA73DRAFT_181707 [Serpula lacrymans var. lacrymans S7.3]|uniref:Cytochrome P450 n=2 Tax=Serpula lacrymans var. lacrymans TaxID=341189 RepID=F8PYJ6_SERL3|nr:uncharacterized protein SERLADRAFT_468039 [Serpula lacrymans var. lacrymans S7.9]EGN98959.1 hypothetical protein SERLA73DRAFT_181707 [Serpula lacrymans var. lacrymans S7.3]EGO24548.1 hypothetical protein SERLADRAFT_468039 [Serpula lacrymans var. lacrymans S7.9]